MLIISQKIDVALVLSDDEKKFFNDILLRFDTMPDRIARTDRPLAIEYTALMHTTVQFDRDPMYKWLRSESEKAYR